jgi:hypothetical protein
MEPEEPKHKHKHGYGRGHGYEHGRGHGHGRGWGQKFGGGRGPAQAASHSSPAAPKQGAHGVKGVDKGKYGVAKSWKAAVAAAAQVKKHRAVSQAVAAVTRGQQTAGVSRPQATRAPVRGL